MTITCENQISVLENTRVCFVPPSPRLPAGIKTIPQGIADSSAVALQKLRDTLTHGPISLFHILTFILDNTCKRSHKASLFSCHGKNLDPRFDAVHWVNSNPETHATKATTEHQRNRTYKNKQQELNVL